MFLRKHYLDANNFIFIIRNIEFNIIYSVIAYLIFKKNLLTNRHTIFSVSGIIFIVINILYLIQIHYQLYFLIQPHLHQILPIFFHWHHQIGSIILRFHSRDLNFYYYDLLNLMHPIPALFHFNVNRSHANPLLHHLSTLLPQR